MKKFLDKDFGLIKLFGLKPICKIEKRKAVRMKKKGGKLKWIK